MLGITADFNEKHYCRNAATSIFTIEGVFNMMIIITGNGISDLSSNPR